MAHLVQQEHAVTLKVRAVRCGGFYILGPKRRERTGERGREELIMLSRVRAAALGRICNAWKAVLTSQECRE